MNIQERSQARSPTNLLHPPEFARMVHRVFRSSEENYLARGALETGTIARAFCGKDMRMKSSHTSYDTDLYTAPTWSWRPFLGKQSPIMNFEESRWHVNVLDTKILPIDHAFGPVEGCILMVQCSLCMLHHCVLGARYVF